MSINSTKQLLRQRTIARTLDDYRKAYRHANGAAAAAKLAISYRNGWFYIVTGGWPSAPMRLDHLRLSIQVLNDRPYVA